MLFSLTGYAQYDCSTAVVYTPGTEEMPLNYVEGTSTYWFSYTASEMSAVTVSICTNNVSLDVYSSCENSEYVSVTNSYCDKVSYSGRVITFQMEEGQTYYIKVTTYASINETIKITSIPMTLGGASCSDAMVLVDGINIIPVNREDYNYATWLVYTPEITGVLKLTAIDYNYFPASYYHANCDDIYGSYLSSSGATLKINVEKDVPVLIKMANGGVINIDVRCEVATVGSDCDIPITAVIGENTLNGESAGNHWYSFTPDFSGFVEISACDFENYIDVDAFLFNSCFAGYDKKSTYCPEDGIGFYLRHKVEQGREYKVNIMTQAEVDNFNFTIARSAALIGEECNSALAMTQGLNTHPGTTEYWYEYVATGNKYLEISSCGNSDAAGYFTIYTNCNNWVASSTSCQSGGSYAKFLVLEGQSYYIKWTLYSEVSSFEFTANEIEIMPGDVCDNPIVAEYGENTIEAASVSRNTFFEYNAANDGWLSVSICDSRWYGGSIAVRSTCTSIGISSQFTTCSSGTGAVYRFPVSKGENYIIDIYNTSIFDSPISFTITEEQFEDGDICENAILVDDITKDIALDKTQGEIWYRFRTTTKGYYTISSNTLPSSGSGSSILVKKGDCDGESTYAYYDYTINTFAASMIVPADTDVLVCVKLYSQTSGVTWKVDSRDVVDGESCGQPIYISESFDTPNMTGDMIWYAYTAPSNGNLTVGTCGTNITARMEFYDSCDSYLLAATQSCSDYSGSYLEWSVESGKTYYLCLKSIYGVVPVNMTFESTDTGIEQAINPDRLLIEPNPNDGYFRVHLDNFAENQSVMMDIVNMQGQLVYRQNVQQGTLVYVVDKRGLPTGIYNLILTGDNNKVVKKFIVVD